MSTTSLIVAENVSKKFCRDLKKSLWYGVMDISSEVLGLKSQILKLRKKEFWAINNVSFNLKQGEVLGLIGRNGAGKTTLLKLLNGLIKPDSGKITMRGRTGALIALGAGFNPILTGRENVFVNGAVLGLTKNEISNKFDEIVDFAELWDFIDAPVQSYSSGMQVRLGFAVAAQMDPAILLTDEVLAVGDFSFRNKCYARLQKLKAGGVSTILVSHNMTHILQFTDRVIWLEGGAIKQEGDPRDVCGAYLSDRIIDNNSDIHGYQNSGLYGEVLAVTDIITDIEVVIDNYNQYSENILNAFNPFKIRYNFKSNVTTPLGITLKIHKKDGQILTIFNNLIDGIEIIPKDSIVSGCLNVGSLNLIPGEYVIVMVIMAGTEFLYRNVVKVFTISEENQIHDIFRHDIGSGIMRINHEWFPS